jgi:LuxR family transcriptional regulator, regulator of acetate metabolism
MTVAATLAALETILEQLRGITDPHALERRFRRDAAASCGFARVMLSRVEPDDWRPWTISFAPTPDPDRLFARRLRGTRIPFADSPTESRVRAELVPVVLEAGASPPPQLARLARTYVVAPLVGSTGVFGLIHADHGRDTEAIAPLDRNALWLLADGFARRYERALLTERIRNQQALLRHALDHAQGSADQIATTPAGIDDVPSARAIPAPYEPRLPQILSPREREVAELLARGCSNAVIARELVIVEGTAKTHVKNIMRKLRANTRAEAIALILGGQTATR